MPKAHCSNCCPIVPPKVEIPGPMPWGAFLWLGILVGVGGGAYWLVMWMLSSAF